MADLLTHVLVPYVLLTVMSWRFPQITKRWIIIGMAGTAIPDLGKTGIVLDKETIESLLGIPFSYGPISSLGGVLIIAATIAIFFQEERWHAYIFLAFGGLTHLVVDGMRMFVDGRAGFWLYPIWWRPPTPNLYVTSDPRVLLLTLLVSAVVFLIDRYR